MKVLLIGFLIFLLAVGIACIHRRLLSNEGDAKEETATEFRKANESFDRTLKLPRGM